MSKRFRLLLSTLVLAALPSALFAGGSEIWPIGSTRQAPAVVVVMAGGLPLGLWVDA